MKNSSKLKIHFLFIAILVITTLLGCADQEDIDTTRDRLVRIGHTTFNMLYIPDGMFIMGCSRSNEKCDADTLPNVAVKMPAFRIMSTEATWAMWSECVSAEVCKYNWASNRKEHPQKPVDGVSYLQITTKFIPWLNKMTGQTFRLPSEAEWEYAARAGSTTKYPWGDEITCKQATYGSYHCHDVRPTQVKTYKPNAFGLYDVVANVGEIVEDCWHPVHTGVPNNGSPRTKIGCESRVVKGGFFDIAASWLSLSYRISQSNNGADGLFGFRLAQDI